MTHPYAHPDYVNSLSHIGQSLFVPDWNMPVLLRNINGVHIDATGAYPLTIIDPAANLRGGLEFLRKAGAVSLVAVLDDFHRPDLDSLRAIFDFVRPLKTHFVHKPDQSGPSYAPHHRYEVKRAKRSNHVAQFSLAENLGSWCDLYAELVRRHQLKGQHDFPRAHFEALAHLPGVTALGAWQDNVLVSAHIWVEHAGRIHSHLAASSPAGYKSGAAYAVNDLALRHFASASLINFGGGAGFGDAASDGLSKFKAGFSNQTASAYLAGMILDKGAYARLSEQRQSQDVGGFFPAYRAGH